MKRDFSTATLSSRPEVRQAPEWRDLSPGDFSTSQPSAAALGMTEGPASLGLKGSVPSLPDIVISTGGAARHRSGEISGPKGSVPLLPTGHYFGV